MSATSFRAADEPAALPPTRPPVVLRGEAAGGRTVRRRPPVGFLIDAALACFAVAVVLVMRAEPEWAAIPYHLLFLSLMLVYGFRVWPLLPTALVVVGITLVTGTLIVGDYRDGVIDRAELAEIPLMPALLVAMVWHARRRSAAHLALQRMAETQRTMLERERTFFRDTSHAIRTPVTIARGHLELVDAASAGTQVSEDVGVALRQLDRMSVLSNRLLALAQLDSGETLPAQRLDLAMFIAEVGDNWSAACGRTWEVGCPPGAGVDADLVWLALAVDALVENAVHFTADGGWIEIRGTVATTTCSIVVSDDGPGIAADDLDHVFERFWHRRPPSGPMGSGLGLAMALATARASGGDLHVSNLDRGGARFELVLPRSRSLLSPR
jgi:signal transduction histidine kinase